MLIGVDPLLGPDLLASLRAMGHGDEIALVDGNYPAQSDASRLVRADGHGLIAVMQAILPLLPLDEDGEFAVMRACNAQHPDRPDPIHSQIDALAAALPHPRPVGVLRGAEFYDRVRACHTIVATSERQLYGNVILRKGVIRPDSPKDQ